MAEALKNIYSKNYIKRLAQALAAADPQFDKSKFCKLVFSKEWADLGLKQRMTKICESLAATLPNSYSKSLKIMTEACDIFGHGSFDKMFFPQYVSMFGRDKKNRAQSLKALQFFTKDSSAEFAVRPFILDDPPFMIDWMVKNSQNKNYHLRRLASEGVRPRLPWAPALNFLKIDPRPILPILENLKNDPELYVRRSVANCLNDISKDHPEIALETLNRWQKTSPSKSVDWITRHALRGLVKSGHRGALATVGYKPPLKLEVKPPRLHRKKVPIGSSLEFVFTLQNKSRKQQKLLIDYVVHFRKKNGLLKPKVFKMTSKVLGPGERVELKKKHSFKMISTRTYYPGLHSLQLQINGQTFPKADFELTD